MGLEDEFPFGMAYFQGRTLKFQGCKMKKSGFHWIRVGSVFLKSWLEKIRNAAQHKFEKKIPIMLFDVKNQGFPGMDSSWTNRTESSWWKPNRLWFFVGSHKCQGKYFKILEVETWTTQMKTQTFPTVKEFGSKIGCAQSELPRRLLKRTPLLLRNEW